MKKESTIIHPIDEPMWIYQRSKNSIVKMKSQGGMRSEEQVQIPTYILYTYLRIMFNVTFIFVLLHYIVSQIITIFWKINLKNL